MDGITSAVVGALAGAVVVIAMKSIMDIPTAFIAAFTIIILLFFKKFSEPYIILVAAIAGYLLKLSYS